MQGDSSSSHGVRPVRSEIRSLAGSPVALAAWAQHILKHLCRPQDFLLLEPSTDNLQTDRMAVHFLWVVQLPDPFIFGIPGMVGRISPICLTRHASDRECKGRVIQEVPDLGIPDPS